MKMNRIVKIVIIVIFLLLFSLFGMKLFVNHNKNKFQIPVLMYHNIVLDDFLEMHPDGIQVTTFENQLKYLHDNNYKTLTMDELYDWLVNGKEIPKKSVVITFDDGFYSFHYLAEPLLKKYDMHAICFVIGNLVGDLTPEFDPFEYGTIGKDLINNHSQNVEYGSHSYNLHQETKGVKKIQKLSKKELEEDVKKENSIYDFKYMAYPFNVESKKMISVLKKYNYKLAFKGESEMVSRSANQFEITRIGVDNNMDHFKEIFESNKYKNRYGYGFIRKVMITLERKIGKRLF